MQMFVHIHTETQAGLSNKVTSLYQLGVHHKFGVEKISLQAYASYCLLCGKATPIKC